MYPTVTLSLFADRDLARTGAPIAALLIVGSVLLIVGIGLLRTSRRLGTRRVGS